MKKLMILEKFTQETFGSRQLNEALGLYPSLAHARKQAGYLKPLVEMPGSGHPMLVTGEEFLRLALAEHLSEKFPLPVAHDISMLFDSNDWRAIISLGCEFFVVELDKSRPLIRAGKCLDDNGFGAWHELDIEDLDGNALPHGKEFLVIEARKLCEKVEGKLQAME